MFTFLTMERLMRKKEIFVSKISSLLIGIIAIVLGIVFQGQNVAFLVGLAFAIAASTNFPILFFNHYLERTNNKWCFLWRYDWFIPAIILVILSPTIWAEIFNF